MAGAQGSTKDLLETARVREVVGVVHSRDKLDTVTEHLMTAGFDRAAINLMASQDAVAQKLRKAYRDPVAAADLPEVPQRQFVLPSDKESLTALVFGTLISIGSLGAALPVVASGGAIAAAVAAAIAGGAAVGGIAEVIKDRIVRRSDNVHLDDELRHGGLILFVRVDNSDREAKALAIMRDDGADSVHVQEVAVPKRVQDIPLAEITPDPWLGPEKLGG